MEPSSEALAHLHVPSGPATAMCVQSCQPSCSQRPAGKPSSAQGHIHSGGGFGQETPSCATQRARTGRSQNRGTKQERTLCEHQDGITDLPSDVSVPNPEPQYSQLGNQSPLHSICDFSPPAFPTWVSFLSSKWSMYISTPRTFAHGIASSLFKSHLLKSTSASGLVQIPFPL